MRGISFKIKNASNKILYDIFKGIDVSKYFWEINVDGFLIVDNDYKGAFFEGDSLKGSDFSKLISEKMYYIIFIDLFSYKSESYIDDEDIESYEDFLKSNCEFAMFIADSEYVDIYCKDVEIIEIIKKNAVKCEYTNIQYITDENDQRKSFNAFFGGISGSNS